MKSLVILISGHGSNMQALLKAKLPFRVAAVISNNPGATGLEIAKAHGIETAIVDHRAYLDRKTFDVALAEKVDSYQPCLIVLAGFMRILGNDFVDRYSGKLMNIHPSLLPAFPGLCTHARALQDGVKIHGCTVHFVTSQIDCGPIIIQAAVSVLSNDTKESLAARVLQQEHRIYPEAVRWFMEGRLRLIGNHVKLVAAVVDESTLCSPKLHK
ncbi:MAG: phosphoribosylglycinamide formyltransferase [Nitrosomonadaceae bacterium]|nr:phosphoribosylglycinamide formyltransferase [Nitrosomonadaceae bacterium]